MDNMMEYKGYFAEIKYSDEDECFCGGIEGLEKNSITFEGNTVEELKKDFRDAIDSYLEFCKVTNTEPEKQYKGSLNVRIGPELHCKAKRKAKEKNISINELIKNAVAMYLKTN